MTFRTGPDINPFSAGARDGIKLLESITPVQLASAVPRLVIRKIDFETGRPVEDVRPLMFDLVDAPQFGSAGSGQDFGVDRDVFLERSTVSLESLEVKSELQYGVDALRQVTLKFTVHQPSIVFDRDAKIPWREILEEGKSFSLEYGWTADPIACPNELFNGFGHVTDQGIVIRSTQTVLLIVASWNADIKQSGDVEITVQAYENGDIALRETRFADAAGAVLNTPGQNPWISDDDAARGLFNRLKSVTPQVLIGRGRFYRLGDVLDELAAPMLEQAVRTFGYRGNPPIRMTLANFNAKAGRQSEAWGGRHMGGVTSIADFLIPADRLMEEFSKHLASGRAMLLRNFLNYLFKFVNSDEAWARVRGDELRPNIGVGYDTFQTREGLTLNMIVLDRNAVSDNVKKLSRLPLDRQTKADVLQALDDADVPVLEFGRAGSMILEATFQMQPDQLFHAIQVETAEHGRKDRVQKTKMPDVESRAGQARPKDIIPISSLQGDVTMLGNFVFGPFDRVWVEFFGSSQISGIFNILEKTDRIEAGRFTSTFHLISESMDPLNTRNRFDELELKNRGKK
ncbi:MAG TPA: hypothetical protein VFT74_18795 [Isosphaeraceae bacterium]|nr:hypothetical protein [Isosphaeraceae bacterium]